MTVPTAPVAAGSLIGGYLVARESGVRPLGGAVLAAGGAYCAREWNATLGRGGAAALLSVAAASGAAALASDLR